MAHHADGAALPSAGAGSEDADAEAEADAAEASEIADETATTAAGGSTERATAARLRWLQADLTRQVADNQALHRTLQQPQRTRVVSATAARAAVGAVGAGAGLARGGGGGASGAAARGGGVFSV